MATTSIISRFKLLLSDGRFEWAGVVRRSNWRTKTTVFLICGLVSVLQAETVYYVSPQGTTEGDGSREKPFADLEVARDVIRTLISEKRLSDGGVTVNLDEGVYRIGKPFDLSESDSGTEQSPVVYRGRGADVTILSGGIKLEADDFVPVKDPVILARIPEEAHGRVLQIDLGITNVKRFGEVPLSGHGMEFLEKVTTYRSGPPAAELFFDGKALPVARWPNEGYAVVKDVVATGSIPRLWQEDMIGKKSSFVGEGKGYIPPEKRETPPDGFAITVEGDRAQRWRSAEEAMLFGYWFHNWSDQTVQLAKVDKQGVLHSVQPSAYGVKAGQRFYVSNLLEELDAPGEWYLDRRTGFLYLMPPEGGLEGRDLEVSLLAGPLVKMKGTSHVYFENLGFSSSRGRGIEISGGRNNVVKDCGFHRLASNAVSVYGGEQHVISGCLVTATGAGGIIISGGDRQLLKRANHRVEGCIITDFSRLVKTYSPAIDISGVGISAVANRISNGPHVGIRFAGNDHLIEGNDISRVCLEADDMGAVYAGRDVSARGSVIRNNYIHDLPPPAGFAKPLGCHGVYLDDQFCGTFIENNVFHNIGGLNVVINGGRDNVVKNNTFIIDPEFAPRVRGLSRFAAVGVSNIGMDPRRIGPDGLPPMPRDVPFNSPAYAKYQNLASILSEEPLRPMYNRVEDNLCLGIPGFYFHQFRDTGVSEEQVLEWNSIGEFQVFYPGGRMK